MPLVGVNDVGPAPKTQHYAIKTRHYAVQSEIQHWLITQSQIRSFVLFTPIKFLQSLLTGERTMTAKVKTKSKSKPRAAGQ